MHAHAYLFAVLALEEMKGLEDVFGLSKLQIKCHGAFSRIPS